MTADFRPESSPSMLSKGCMHSEAALEIPGDHQRRDPMKSYTEI
jgi:hypothetical protein